MQIHKDFQLSKVLWYKIGGKAKYFLICENRDDIVSALEFIAEKKPNKVFFCGQGTNLIFTDEYFDGAVVQIVSATRHSGLSRINDDREFRDSGRGLSSAVASAKESLNDIIVKDNHITAFAGTILDDVIVTAFEHQLIGLEWAGGLPGTVGAGVRGNVGAYGGEVKDSLLHAEVIDYSGEEPKLKTLTNEELEFVYRGSLIKSHKKMIVVAATFGLKKGTDEEVIAAKEVYEKNRQNRRDKHPLEYPNCGSVFKNLRDPEQVAKVIDAFPDLKELVEKKWYGKVAVASVIEKFGLKGHRVGNAQVSEKHALFIINLGGAKAADVLQIIADIKSKFQSAFGFEPEVEVEIVQ